MKAAPLRRIVKRERWRDRSCPNAANGSVRVELECGHSNRYKASEEPNTHARCVRCRQEGRP